MVLCRPANAPVKVVLVETGNLENLGRVHKQLAHNLNNASVAVKYQLWEGVTHEFSALVLS